MFFAKASRPECAASPGISTGRCWIENSYGIDFLGTPEPWGESIQSLLSAKGSQHPVFPWNLGITIPTKCCQPATIWAKQRNLPFGKIPGFCWCRKLGFDLLSHSQNCKRWIQAGTLLEIHDKFWNSSCLCQVHFPLVLLEDLGNSHPSFPPIQVRSWWELSSQW